MLRYQIMTTQKEQSVVEFTDPFLNDFLNLEKVRQDKFEYVISKKKEILVSMVATIIVYSFRDAVKHNVDSENSSYVYLCFKVWDKQLEFQCINSKPKIALRKNEIRRLGLKNIKAQVGCCFRNVTRWR